MFYSFEASVILRTNDGRITGNGRSEKNNLYIKSLSKYESQPTPSYIEHPVMNGRRSSFSHIEGLE